MGSNLYWISTLTYALFLIIMLVSDAKVKGSVTETEKKYRLMANWVVVFCFQDTFWGLCENGIIKGDTIFFIASSVFHIMAVGSTIFWLNYMLSFAGEKMKFRKTCLWINGLVILFELVLVLINIFSPTLFSIRDGVYVTEHFRSVTFINQYVIYLLIGGSALMMAIRDKEKNKERYLAILIFSVAPIAMGVFQLLYPDAPFYSLGYFLGCFVVHIFVVTQERENAEKNNVLKSIAATYYSMHLVDLETMTMERFIESDILVRLIGNETRAQQMADAVFGATVSDEYQEMIQEFTNLSTLSERMGDNNLIYCEFVGRNYGWTRVSFVSVEKVDGIQKKVMLITQIIDSDKREQIELLFKSNNDELTGLSNRRAFETDVWEKKDNVLEENLVFISIDVNELKVVNDTLGHVAGDELLIGAAECMKKCFSPYGKIYRTGGDEFCAIIFASASQLQQIKRNFEDTILEWRGELVDSVSVSCGYVTRAEVASANLHEMSILADERMYAAKADHYRKKGIDRRGQKDAHSALCALYTKILKINITEDTYQIVNMDVAEQTGEKGFSDHISTWLSDFGKSGQVHPDDLECYLSQTNLSYMRDYFSRGKTSLSVFYRRMIDDTYKQVMMEIIPASDYTPESQSLYLYVKNIDK